MIKIGQTNTLEVVRKAEFGLFLDADDYGTVLLPNKHVPAGVDLGSEIDVFLYFDSDNQLCATTEMPIAQVGEWGLMKIEGINSTGAFASWGIDKKDLLIPFSEQRARFRPGQEVLVYVYTDKASGRIVGTTKFNKWLDKTPAKYTKNQQVELIIAERSDLGFKAIVNGEHWGMIFRSDVFGKLFIGKRLKGYIKSVREDGKIDLSLQKVGTAKMDDLSNKIIETLEKKDGFLPLNDKSTPEAIFAIFRTSKGTFKKTIGGLYKQGKIVIEKDGIRLNK
ncbi:putative nucleic acid binding protein, YitL type [Vibrio nigripulchritudo SFn27]|uniref:Putative nucleic acid binding protein, YitL type n=1 Tax=Vibrio nigripulchritudo TaxID=28173 RepID=U4JY69_9VIBR|nr:S1-like domain-containing RNA-binding protein [Vibrio nigripulchritudo]CCN84091.1 putative nucleic acid binding protein, YitL type [Vibrio nigripulchritudo BLFn1]CCN87006.1 putative nucleic acid binding protein, YitL type [Vibrio nigripulchritudo SFn27]CCN93289.1 putative nucleic acid binding protein, YitL type [Vibrio nigripulchritudo ENn2]CCO39421.1 putative nucleic acid binding protein, YitL type [Vibrio nigripulchritudo SFn135]CCO54264.1 putative nucleic acid binding protein, YitL type 